MTAGNKALYCIFLALLFMIALFMLLVSSTRFPFGGKVAIQQEETYYRSPHQNHYNVTKFIYVHGHTQPPKEICRDHGAELRLLVLVTSAPKHSVQRNVVRSTWGTYGNRFDISLAFFVGIAETTSDNELIAQENLIYGDIIQGNFLDRYNNLTLKTISMLEWTLLNCNQTKFLLKTDDDMYIHFPVLLPLLDQLAGKDNFILGKIAKRWKPIRNIKSHYYISEEEFGEKYYPDFATGPAYVLSNDVIKPLYYASLDGIFFKLEDVYLTGIIAHNIGVKRLSRSEFYNSRPKKVEACIVKKYAAVHMLKPEEVAKLWGTLLVSEPLKC